MENKDVGAPEAPENVSAEPEQEQQAPQKPQPPMPPEDPTLRSQEAYQKLTMLGVTAFFIVVLIYNLFAKQTQYDLYAVGLGYVAVESMLRYKLFDEKKKLPVSVLAMIGALLSLAVHISLTFHK
ncbi:MAG: DUF6442 family protein [Clostridiaceae bacterium]|nr:DUF6442 family protein [Clostridiaceae bacterium]